MHIFATSSSLKSIEHELVVELFFLIRCSCSKPAMNIDTISQNYNGFLNEQLVDCDEKRVDLNANIEKYYALCTRHLRVIHFRVVSIQIILACSGILVVYEGRTGKNVKLTCST